MSVTAKASAKGMVSATMHDEDQRDAEGRAVQHRVGGDVDQFLAVIDALDAHARGQHAAIVDPLDLREHALDGRPALLAAAHQHDALDDVVVIVLAGNAKARLVADGDRGDVAHAHGGRAGIGDEGVGDVLDR